MREAFATARNLLVALLVIALGEVLIPQSMVRWMWLHRPGLLLGTVGAALFGIFFLVGGAIFRMMLGGRPLTRGEVEAHVKNMRDAQSLPYTTRVSKVWLPAKAAGMGFSDTVSIREAGQAFRAGLWRHDPRWQGFFLMAAGAFLLFVGILGTILVLGSGGIKFMILLVVFYVLVQFLRVGR